MAGPVSVLVNNYEKRLCEKVNIRFIIQRKKCFVFKLSTLPKMCLAASLFRKYPFSGSGL